MSQNYIGAAHTPEIGTVIDDAMRAIEEENKTLKNVLPKNYASPDLDKRILGDVVDIFTNNIDMSGTEVSEDLLGRTYEYCIAQFAEKEGVGGGKFYTPSSIVKTLVAVLKPYVNCRVYDCCCGSGVVSFYSCQANSQEYHVVPQVSSIACCFHALPNTLMCKLPEPATLNSCLA